MKKISLCIVCLLLQAGFSNAATFSVAPSTVSNTYAGKITLAIGGLTNGESVVVQEFLDANTNGAVGPGDSLIQQFRLTDGSASVIGGVTNINVPFDSNPATDAITAAISFKFGGAGIMQQLVGKYNFKVISPTARFTPITNSFTVTNWPYSQSFTGKVSSGSVNGSNAIVLLFSISNSRVERPVAGTVANNSGNYALKAPAGTYGIMAFKTNYVTDFGGVPVLTLTNNATFKTNLNLISATRTISGKVVDAANTNLGLGGLLVTAQSTNYQMGVGFTDTNGNFTIRVTSSLWRLSPTKDQLQSYGYVKFEDDFYPTVDTLSGNVSGVLIPLPKATALIYGTITNDLGQPLPGVSFGNASNGTNSSDATSDENGNYVLGVVAGDWWAGIDAALSGYSNCVFSYGFSGAINDGDAYEFNFTGLLATNRITGTLTDNNGNAIGGVSLHGGAEINGAYYDNNDALTDYSDGSYAMNVANGIWTVKINCEGGDYALNNAGDYHCPKPQTVNISNNNAVANFVVYPSWIPILNQPSRISSSQIVFTFDGSPGNNYTVQVSTNQSFTNWFTLCATNLTTGSAFIRDNQATNKQRLYRVFGQISPPGILSLTTPYVNETDMAASYEAFSTNASAPWGFAHDGVDFTPKGEGKLFQAAATGVVQDISLWQNGSNWQVNVWIQHDANLAFSYAFEPGSSVQSDGQIQRSNIVVNTGQ